LFSHISVAGPRSRFTLIRISMRKNSRWDEVNNRTAAAYRFFDAVLLQRATD
jgi:hypothetical protein